jgi:phosphopantetheine adenylyltransferase
MPIPDDFIKRALVDENISDILGNDIESAMLALTTIKEKYITTMQIEPTDSIRFRGCFDNLLSHYNIPSSVHYITCLLNGLKSSSDFKDELSKIYVIDPEYLSKLERVFMKNTKKEYIPTV